MNNKYCSIAHLAYELYKIDWMRRISPEEKMKVVKNWYRDNLGFDNPVEMVEVLGYNGNLYASFGEFKNNEYRDTKYVKKLLDDDELYQKYLKNVLFVK